MYKNRESPGPACNADLHSICTVHVQISVSIYMCTPLHLDSINEAIIYYLKFESISHFQACINFEKESTAVYKQ